MIVRLVWFGHDILTEDHQGFPAVFNGMQGPAAAVGGRAVKRTLCPAPEVSHSEEGDPDDGPAAS